MSNVEKGNRFRDEVASLLRTVHPNAITEHVLGGTAIDIVFHEDIYGRRMTFAVECKDMKGAITKSFVEQQIWIKYQSLIDNGSVDQVMVVSKHALNREAEEWFRANKRFVHYTVQQLDQYLLGLRDYVQGLARDEVGGSSHYIEARFERSDCSAIEVVRQWIDAGVGNGIAIVAGYGRGKTSFARRLIQDQAKRYLENRAERLPILIRLGQVVHETELEGLFGKEFVAHSPGRGFTFATFMHLNAEGRLLIVLDGFDEMKHAMTVHDFKANFRQFNRLLTGNSKVVLLGRPNAFTSESHELVLRGRNVVAGVAIQSSEFKEWKEFELAKFTSEESKILLESCLSVALNAHRYNAQESIETFATRRANEIFDSVADKDLLARPVHIPLVAELGANPDFSFAKFNQYALYDHFVDRMIERDVENKLARRDISVDDRKRFQRKLAWWAWTREGQSQTLFDREEIPNALLDGLSEGKSNDSGGLLNEYIVSTLTEQKTGGVLYFAHRSYQEFLVAQHIGQTPITPGLHAQYSTLMNHEVFRFMSKAPDQGIWQQWYETLDAAKGPIHADYFTYFMGDHPSVTAADPIKSIDVRSDNAAAAMIMYGLHHLDEKDRPSNFDDWLLTSIAVGSKRCATLALLMACEHALVNELSNIRPRLIGSMLSRCLSAAASNRTDGQVLVVRADGEDGVIEATRAGLRREARPGPGLSIRIDLAAKAALAWLTDDERYLLRDTWMGRAVHQDIGSEVPKETAYGFIIKSLRENHYTFLHAREETFQIVPKIESGKKHLAR